jgi:hypothetical protein
MAPLLRSTLAVPGEHTIETDAEIKNEEGPPSTTATTDDIRLLRESVAGVPAPRHPMASRPRTRAGGPGGRRSPELVRTPEGWRIARRRCRFLTATGLSDRPD